MNNVEKDNQQHPVSNAVTRREFIKKTAAVSVGACILPGLTIGSAKASPKRGGIVKFGISGASTSNTLDPGISADRMPNLIHMNVRSCLMEIAPNGDLVGNLAESWEAKTGAKDWIFKLRKGVEFHNGKSFEAEDVIATINHHRGPDTKSIAKVFAEQIEELETPDKHTVVIKLKSGNADFPFILSDRFFSILPAKDGKADWQSGVGTGGYALASFEPGVRAVLKRNLNYWRSDRAFIDEAHLMAILDVTARTNALVSGQVDMIDTIELKTAHILAKKPGIKVEEVTGTWHYTLPMNTTVAPFDNNDVRMALKHAINRKQILNNILRGHGIVGNDHPIGPNQKYFASDLPQREYDPDKAKFHLKKAGLSSLNVELHCSDTAFSGSVDSGVLYRESALKAGIDIKVVRAPADGYWSDTWMKVPWSMSYWAGRPTEDWMFSIGYASDAPWNETFWKHERFNKLLVEARSELDTSKRKTMYAEMQKICSDEGGAVVPMFQNYVWAKSDKLAHGQVAANQPNDGQKMVERWWLV